MQNSKIRLVGLLLIFAALIANHAVARLDKPAPRILPVETFPQQVGDWRGGEIEPVDPDVQRVLSTAKISARPYTNSAGQMVHLMLITASDVKDFHNPTACFPRQGWKLTDRRKVTVGGHTWNTMLAEQDGTFVRVHYWLGGYQEPHRVVTPMQRSLGALRTRLVGRWEGESLFVRLLSGEGPDSERAARDFMQKIETPLTKLISSPNMGTGIATAVGSEHRQRD